MTESTQDGPVNVAARTTEVLTNSVERSIQMQTELVGAWTETLEGTVPEAEVIAEGIDGYLGAYELWLDSIETLFDTAVGAAEGEDVDPGELRDVWLQSTNEALSELMSTGAFAAVDDRFAETLLAAQLEFDELTQDSLAQAGFATRKDTSEATERLVELERRQRAVEEKLDRILDAVEE